MMPQRPIRFVPLVGLAITVVAGWLVFNPLSLLESPTAEPATARSTTALVVADLTSTFEADAMVEYANQWSPPLTLTTAMGGSGAASTSGMQSEPAISVVTSIAEVGTELSSGTELYRVNDVPAVALLGDMPAWRTMSEGDEGVDVLQLEQALVALGYGVDGSITVDHLFTARTAELVAQWQADLGVDETGTIELGSVVFVPAATRVATVLAEPGDVAPPSAIVFSDADRSATFEVDAAAATSLAVGDLVDVRPDGSDTIVAAITSISFADDGTYLVAAQPAPFDDSGMPDTMPATVSWSRPFAEQVLVAPAKAALRLDDGSYVLEVHDGPASSPDSPTRLVTVEIGAQSGSLVEVVGDGLSPGDLVITGS